MPGSEDVTAKYAKSRGLCQWVIPGISTASRSRRRSENGSGASGGDAGSAARMSRRAHLSEHGVVAHALEVGGDPVERCRAVLAKRAHRESFSISRQGRVFRICSPVSQARRATARPYST